MKHFWTSMLISIALAVVFSVAIPQAAAQETQQTAGVVLEIPEDARAGADFDVDKATEAYINLLSAENRARSDAYMEGGYWLQLWGFLYGLGVAWLLLGTRLSVRMRDFSERFGSRRWLHTSIYSIQYIVVGTVL